MRPWYLRWWGIVIIVYIAVTGVLGIGFIVASRRAPTVPASARDDVLRVGGFTAAETVNSQQSTVNRQQLLVTDSDPTLGATAAIAGVTIVEFSDFQCPFCRAAFPIIRQVASQYGGRGLRYVYRDWFNDELHPDARRAAEAAQCAHAQGKFWAFHDKVFQNQEQMDAKSLAAYARQVGLDGQRFDVCVASKEFASAVQQDIDAGTSFGVRGTPTWFFILGGDVANARRVEGVIPRDVLV
ncbi:DsbA family protein, partial [Candidatus Uhrbacteria bacterium]|nr:DsbA family protein [Candidatus Uhrbacteria bacterium]